MKKMLIATIVSSLLIFSINVHADSTEIESADKGAACSKAIFRAYFDKFDAIVDEYYTAVQIEKTSMNDEVRRAASIRALELSREMDPQIRTMRRQAVMQQASLCK